jgi:hypothetical protein
MKPSSILLLAALTIVRLAAAEPLVDTNAEDAEHAPVVSESEPFRTRIAVRNPNDVAVKVASIDATCTCATLDLADHFLLPHATTTLTVEVDGRNRSEAQRLGVSLYLSDPDLDAIEVVVLWTVRAHVQVDSLPTTPGAETLARPPKNLQDIYRFAAKVRPDELRTLRKRIRLSCPPGEVPEGGLQVTGIEYTGSLYAFTPTAQADGSVLIEARGQDGGPPAAPGIHDEEAVVLTNHPRKPRIPLVFVTYVGKDAGSVGFDPDAKRGDEFKALQAEPGE